MLSNAQWHDCCFCLQFKKKKIDWISLRADFHITCIFNSVNICSLSCTNCFIKITLEIHL